MMRANVEINRTARVCQVASLLVILSLVLGVLAHDIRRGSRGATAEGGKTRIVVVP